MRFLVDSRLPKTLAHRLRESGHAVEHVLELATAQSPDNDLWHFAMVNQAIIITKDEDFAEWVLAGRPGPAIVWLRIGNCTNTDLMECLLPSWPQVIEALEHGDRLIEIT